MTTRYSYIVELTHDEDAALLDRFEAWVLHINYLSFALTILLATFLPAIVGVGLLRFFL